ncbi:hypothetical protein V8E36_003450 [Tilletia maclaganii]
MPLLSGDTDNIGPADPPRSSTPQATLDEASSVRDDRAAPDHGAPAVAPHRPVKPEISFLGGNVSTTAASPNARPLLSEELKIAGNIKKLSGRSNWFTWKIAFFFLIRGVEGAIEYLTGTIDPTMYSHALDIALGRVITQTLEVDQLGQVALLMTSGEMRGSKIYDAIRAPFERTDPATRDCIETTLSNFKQGTHTVAQLAQALRMLFASALNAGLIMDEDRKIYYFLKSLNPKFEAFTGQLNALRRRGLVNTFDEAVEDCVGEETRMAIRTGGSDTTAQAFAAALYGSAMWTGPSGMPENRKDEISNKRFTGKCWRCEQYGHRRSNCTAKDSDLPPRPAVKKDH